MEPQIVLRWATRQDIPAITQILVENFMNFELKDHVAPTRRERPEEYYSLVLRRVKLFYIKSHVRYMVAEASTPSIDGVQQATIVGFSAWEALGKDNLIAQQWRQASSGWPAKLEASLVTLDLQYYRYCLNRIIDYRAFYEAMGRKHKTYENVDWLQNCLHLQFLFVDPAWHRGKGVGRKLLQWGIDVSNQQGLPIVLESSQVGYDFYIKHGFRLLDSVRIDIVPEKAYDAPVVVYEPSRQS